VHNELAVAAQGFETQYSAAFRVGIAPFAASDTCAVCDQQPAAVGLEQPSR
jgi:hypothetical protein